MCLLFIAHQYHPAYPLILAANRDEFYHRPTRPAHFWEDHPQVLGGIDEKSGGTWLGFTRQGRLAALTNYRDPRNLDPTAASRGALVRNFLIQTVSPTRYLAEIRKNKEKFNDFNLLLGDVANLWCYASRRDEVRQLSPGLHGLSNRFLNTPWPKVKKGQKRLAHLLARKNVLDCEDLFQIMQDTEIPPDEDLPETGLGLTWERHLAPMFIQTPSYGTRSTTVILVDKTGQVQFSERNFDPAAGPSPPDRTRTFTFPMPLEGDRP